MNHRVMRVTSNESHKQWESQGSVKGPSRQGVHTKSRWALDGKVGLGYEGQQGDEGQLGDEGQYGTKGQQGYEGQQGIEGKWGNKGNRFPNYLPKGPDLTVHVSGVDS